MVEIKKDKLPPRAPREKPTVHDITDDSVRLAWSRAEIPAHGEQTEIYYIVERR